MDLSTTYMGLRLKNPVVPSASPLSQTLDGIRRMEDAVAGWMEEHEYVSVNQMIGSLSRTNVADPAAFERANYMKMLASYRKTEVRG